MKKITAMLIGIVLCVFCVVGALSFETHEANATDMVESINADSYEQVYNGVIEEFGEGDYELTPKSTIDGIVRQYRVVNLETGDQWVATVVLK